MTDPTETFVSPTAAREGGSQLTGVGERLSSAWTLLSGTISRLNDGKPWGTDEPGTAFNEHYLDGGEEAPAALTLDAGDTLVERMSTLGPGVVSVVDGTVDVDDAVATWFGGEDK